MSMVINLVEDHNIHLCEGGPVYNGGVQPTPITYLTQWKIVGNSEVHDVGNLTSWKVSGNSVVDNNTILSCGDLGQDGKYHVKISNGVDIYDIALNEPLRKVNDVADTIEFPSSVEGKALVTRNIGKYDIDLVDWEKAKSPVFRFQYISNAIKSRTSNIICAKYRTLPGQTVLSDSVDKSIWVYDSILRIRDEDYLNSTVADFQQANLGVLILFELATPTTELVDAPQIAVSPADTYTSANDTPYSAFEHTKHSEIWSCGEYNSTDGKYHILVQPQGGSIADIALDEPLRKVNNVADTVIYPHPSGVSNAAMVSIFLMSFPIDKLIAVKIITDKATGLPVCCRTHFYYTSKGQSYGDHKQANILCDKIKDVVSVKDAINHNGEFIMVSTRTICVRNTAIEQTLEAYQSYFDSLGAIEIICPLRTPYNVDLTVSQIEEAESYSMVISQGGKAVSWSEFLDTLNYLLTDSENNILVDSENYQLIVQN